jgi:hypothetical protein
MAWVALAGSAGKDEAVAMAGLKIVGLVGSLRPSSRSRVALELRSMVRLKPERQSSCSTSVD